MIRKTSTLRFVCLVVMIAACGIGGMAVAAAVPAVTQYAVRPLAEVDVQGYVAITAAQMADEDAQRDQEGLPFRFALPVDVALTVDNAGTWERLPDGQWLWRLRVSSPGVLSLNLGFVRFHLPASARLLVYSAVDLADARRFDTESNAGHGQLWTPVFLNDEVVVELLVPDAERPQVDLELGVIGRGYRFFGEEEKGTSGACNVDVVCPEGDLWRDEIDSVGLLGVGASFICTGAMINNVDSDGRPLFLTAAHCPVSAPTAATVVVYWNYQSPVCGERDGGSFAQTSNGSTLLARYTTSDFTLLELDQQPDPAFNVKYAGWSRSTDNPTSATAIHHPRSDVKSISFENDPLTTALYLNNAEDPAGVYFRVADWDQGTTEAGSSGSPLFDQNHLIVGQLRGGYAACNNELADWYGMIAASWEGGGLSDSRLRDYLDPSGSGAMTAPLFDPDQAGFEVTPAGTAATGMQGGPFDVVDHVFTLTTRDIDPADFTASTETTWLDLDTSAGTVNDGAPVAVTASLNALAADLPEGVHHGSVSFTDPDVTGGSVVRGIVLTVTELIMSLEITPATEASSAGVAGGVFAPANHTYSVTNTSTVVLDFTVQSSEAWLALDISSGSLAIDEQISLTATVTTAASDLAIGKHRSTISFTYPPGGSVVNTREVVVTVTANGLTMTGPVPNPFSRPPVAIRYTLGANATVRARVTNLRGLNVRDLGNFAGVTGENDIPWNGLDDNGRRVPSGVYVVTIEGLGQKLRTNITYAH